MGCDVIFRYLTYAVVIYRIVVKGLLVDGPVFCVPR